MALWRISPGPWSCCPTTRPNRKRGCIITEAISRSSYKRYDDALSSFGKAAEIYDTLGNPIGLGDQLGNIGSVHRDREEWDAALEHYSKSLAVFEKAGHTRGMADQYSNIAYAHSRQARFKSAFEFFRKAKALYDEVGEQMKSQLCDQNMQALTPYIEK